MSQLMIQFLCQFLVLTDQVLVFLAGTQSSRSCYTKGSCKLAAGSRRFSSQQQVFLAIYALPQHYECGALYYNGYVFYYVLCQKEYLV